MPAEVIQTYDNIHTVAGSNGLNKRLRSADADI